MISRLVSAGGGEFALRRSHHHGSTPKGIHWNCGRNI